MLTSIQPKYFIQLRYYVVGAHVHVQQVFILYD